MSKTRAERAIRVRATGAVQGVGFRATVVERAHEAGVLGWVRNEDDGSVLAHVEGDEGPVESLAEFFSTGPSGAQIESTEIDEVKPEGHEQFAIRGVSAGSFIVEAENESDRFRLGLEVDGAMRWWTLPKGPTMDPATKRMAIEVKGGTGEPDDSGGETWDRGAYEQGGRVPWPEAVERGHAVFVLHGERLRGGFALQRTRGNAPQWLFIKRRDDDARPGVDVVAEHAAD